MISQVKAIKSKNCNSGVSLLVQRSLDLGFQKAGGSCLASSQFDAQLSTVGNYLASEWTRLDAFFPLLCQAALVKTCIRTHLTCACSLRNAGVDVLWWWASGHRPPEYAHSTGKLGDSSNSHFHEQVIPFNTHIIGFRSSGACDFKLYHCAFKQSTFT